MKKYFVCLAVFMLFVGCSACSTESETTPVKTEEQIISDLEQSYSFWSIFAPDSTTYRITNLTVEDRETVSEVSDDVIVSVIAESDIAAYTGSFHLGYQYSSDAGYVLYGVYQPFIGTYSDVKLPSDTDAKALYQEADMLTYIRAYAPYDAHFTLQSISVTSIPNSETQCTVTVELDARSDLEHCTSKLSAVFWCRFANGAWAVDFETNMTTTELSRQYDQSNGVFWSYDSALDTLELINAYVEGGHQYYDRFNYYSYAELNYKDVIEYGFTLQETHILAENCYIGGEQMLTESPGQMDEPLALQYIDQIRTAQKDVLIILDAKQYLLETLPDPKLIIVSKEYIDDTGLHVANVAHYGTVLYDEAIHNTASQ